MSAEMGAALERQILLSEPEETLRRPPRGLPRGLFWLIFASFLAALAGSAVFFFIQVRGSWERRLTALEGDLERVTREGADRVEALLLEAQARDQEIAKIDAEKQTLARILDKTLQELSASLEDLRLLREEKRTLDAECFRLRAAQESPVSQFFLRWLPRWLAEGARRGSRTGYGPAADPGEPGLGESAPAGRDESDAPEQPALDGDASARVGGGQG